MGDFASLANSLQKIGLINPIVITPDEVEAGMFLLIAGERRLRAAKTLGWASIETSLLSELDETTRTLIELEENVRRKQLTWQEECQAILKFNNLSKRPAPEIARDLGLHEKVLSRQLTVARAFDRYPRITTASSVSAAYQMLEVIQERENESLMESLNHEVKSAGAGLFSKKAPTPDELLSETLVVKELIKGNPPEIYPLGQFQLTRLEEPPHLIFPETFQEWVANYDGPRFNLIHCDFPYGLNMDKEALQNSRPSLDLAGELYDDSPELFNELLSTLIGAREKLFANSCHLVFWTAFKNYQLVKEILEDDGWRVCDGPLVWHKTDNRGIAPDVRRWPRRTYETALFASLGDRRLVNLRAASIGLPTANDIHLSTKPFHVLYHFLGMLVDNTTEMLDPTCGSGTALEAAAALGAARIVGVEKEKRYFEASKKALERGLKMKEVLS